MRSTLHLIDPFLVAMSGTVTSAIGPSVAKKISEIIYTRDSENRTQLCIDTKLTY